MLGALRLAGHRQTGGDVSDPNRRFHFVDILSSLTPGTKGVDPKIRWRNVHINILINLGNHIDTGKTRMAPFVGIKRRNPNQPMDATLCFAEPIGIVALDHQTDTLHPRRFPRQDFGDLRLISPLLAPPLIHAQQHIRPVTGFRASRPGIDAQNTALGVMGSGQQRPQFKIFQRLL